MFLFDKSLLDSLHDKEKLTNVEEEEKNHEENDLEKDKTATTTICNVFLKKKNT